MIRFLLFFTIAVSMASAVLAFLTKEKATELSDKLSSSSQMVGALKTENGKLKEEKTVASQVEALNGSTQQQKDELEKARAATVPGWRTGRAKVGFAVGPSQGGRSGKKAR
jgi:PIN domain nuclease of toxin-antitoxin system